MRYKELMESNERFDDWWPRIEKECGDIIWSYKQTKSLFYRGANDRGLIYRAEPLSNRYSLNSSQADHEFLTALMVLAGEKVTRKNSIAMTSNPNMASGYGTVYVIFPCDGFNFLFSESKEDWYDFVEGFKSMFVAHLASRFGDRLDLQAINYTGPRDSNSLIHTLMSLPMEKMNQVIQANDEIFLDMYDRFTTQNHFNRSSIETALESRNEVMFSGAPYYMTSEVFTHQLGQKLGFIIG